MHVSAAVFTCSGLSAIVVGPLAALSLGAIVIEAINEVLNIKEIMIEYKKCYKFYNDLLLSYKAGQIDEKNIFIKEKEFLKNIKYFCVEKYLKNKKLNGYTTQI